MYAEAGAGLVKYTILHIQQLNVGKGNFSITDYICMYVHTYVHTYIHMYDFYLTGKIIK